MSGAAERDAGDIHRADVAELLLGQEVTDVAEVDRVDAIDFDDEGDLLARFGPAGVVAIGPDARDQDLLDLVLARDRRGRTRSSRLDGRSVCPSRECLPLARGSGAIVGVAEGDDVTGDPAARRSRRPTGMDR